MDNNEVVAVVGLHKGTKSIKAVTSCERKDAQQFAKYYRSIGYGARIVTYDELDTLLDKERAEQSQYLFV